MNDVLMGASRVTNNGMNCVSNLDFCTGDDFSSISHSSALVSPTGVEFDLIVKVANWSFNIYMYRGSP